MSAARNTLFIHSRLSIPWGAPGWTGIVAGAVAGRHLPGCEGLLLLLAADVGHVRHARDLPVLVHADVLVADRVVVFRQRVDHDLVEHAVPLVIDADALVIDDFDRGLGAFL